jgi:hypothetical protein
MKESLRGLIEAESNSRGGLSVWAFIGWTTEQIEAVEELRDLSDPFWKRTHKILLQNLDYQWGLHSHYSNSEYHQSRAEKAKKRLLKGLESIYRQARD